MVSIPACHAGDRGSIPRRGVLFFSPLLITTKKVQFKSENIEWFVEGTYEGLKIIFSTNDVSYTEAQLRESLHITEEPGQLTFQTWFGVKVALRNEFIAIKPALAYS